jgi:P27 family predicted phage terminase small subunit
LPSAIKQARGTYRADRAPAREAKALGKPTCPSWLKDADAKREFKRLCKLLGEMGLLGAADTNLLARYCVNWIRWRRVSQTLASNPGAEFMVIKDDKGQPKMMQVSAVHSVERSLADQLTKAEASLGMNPSARSRITIEHQENEGMEMPPQ